MSKLLKGSIDLMKIDKTQIVEGKNGAKYINLDIWINDDEDKYGNHAGIKQSYKEGDEFKSHYIGNGKKGIGWGDDTNETTPRPNPPAPVDDDDDDLPF